MYNQIKNIFKNKIIDNPTSINQNDYYYFYKDSKCKNYFGIKKDIPIRQRLHLIFRNRWPKDENDCPRIHKQRWNPDKYGS